MEELLLQFRSRLIRAESLCDFIGRHFHSIYYTVVREMDDEARKSLAVTIIGQINTITFSPLPGGTIVLRSFWLDGRVDRGLVSCANNYRRMINGKDHLAMYATIGLAVHLWDSAANYREAWRELAGQPSGQEAMEQAFTASRRGFREIGIGQGA